MSSISDAIEATDKAVDAAIRRAQEDALRLAQDADELDGLAGKDKETTEEDLTRIDSIRQKIAALDPEDPEVLTNPDNPSS